MNFAAAADTSGDFFLFKLFLNTSQLNFVFLQLLLLHEGAVYTSQREKKLINLRCLFSSHTLSLQLRQDTAQKGLIRVSSDMDRAETRIGKNVLLVCFMSLECITTLDF